MLTGSTLLRVLLTVVVAALLAALWQALPPLSGGTPAPSTPPVVRAEPSRPQVVPRAGGPSTLPGDAPPAAPPQAAAPFAPPPAPVASASPPLPAPDDVALAPAAGATDLRAGTPAAADTRPVAVGLLDLNAASVQDLNRLRGGGLIGRAVIRGRPYTAVSDLLTKRVISRSVYERIRDQVTVR